MGATEGLRIGVFRQAALLRRQEQWGCGREPISCASFPPFWPTMWFLK